MNRYPTNSCLFKTNL